MESRTVYGENDVRRITRYLVHFTEFYETICIDARYRDTIKLYNVTYKSHYATRSIILS